MPNAYVTLSALKGTAALNFTGTAYDARLLVLVEAVSRQIDAYCGRHFYPLTETRNFDGPSPSGTRLPLPDFVALTAVTEDTNSDGTFETTWATSDYVTWPYNAAPTSAWGRAHMALMVNAKSNGSQDAWLTGQQMYQIAGTWGWRAYLVDTGERGSGTLTAAGTALTLTASSTLSVGQTVRIESEYLYIRSTGTAGTATGAGIVTVDRAVNGSTGTAHSTGTVQELVHPLEVAEACLIQVARLLKRRESGFATQLVFPETGAIMTFSSELDPDVKLMLARYRRMVV